VRQTQSDKDEVVAAAVRYVRKRDEVFQYERRVPQRVQRDRARFAELFGSKALFRRSLRTKNHGEMHAAAYAVHLEFENLVARALGRVVPVAVSAPRALRKVTQGDLDALVERYSELTAKPFEQAYLMADSSPAFAGELERMHSELEIDAENLRSALRDKGATSKDLGFETPSDIARHVIEGERLDVKVGTPEFGAIVSAIRAGIEQGYRRIDGLEGGTILPKLPAQDAKQKPAALTLSETVKLYVRSKSLPPKTVSEVNLSLRIFEELHGNKALDSITRSDFIKFVEHLGSLDIGGKTPGSVQRPLSSQTMKKRLGFLRAAINHAIDRDLFDGRNPASNVKVDPWVRKVDAALMPAKRSFQIGELNKILQYPWFTGALSQTDTHRPGNLRLNDEHYWVPVVAIYTGCRAKELAGIRLDEVVIDDPHPHIRIRDNEYRGTKGSYSRFVPLIDAFLALGFKEYVNRVRREGHDRLFPNWEQPIPSMAANTREVSWSNAPLIRAFNRTLIPAVLGSTFVKGARLEVSFHGLRGSFKTMLQLHNVPMNVVNEIIGHSKSELDQRYIGTIPIEKTYPLVRNCDYEGLVVPKLEVP
jgi:integrase